MEIDLEGIEKTLITIQYGLIVKARGELSKLNIGEATSILLEAELEIQQLSFLINKKRGS